MFSRQGKTSRPVSTKPLKDLTAILVPEQLFLNDRRQELLQKIKTDCSWHGTRFDTIGMTLIHNLAHHCQSLPETSNSYYALEGGLLDHALNRTEAALELFHQYIVKENDELSEEQSLWLYALFSASLLQGIGKLPLDYQVELFDTNGQKLKTWNPLLENLTSSGSYYHYEFQQEHDEKLRRLLNVLLARMLMPAQGFAWIAANSKVLAVWLALLHEDWQSAGTLGAILVRADAIAIQRYFNDLLARLRVLRSGRLGRRTTFVDTLPETLEEKERMIGLEFIDWLTQALENGQIMINKAPLFMVPGGMLMSTEIFKWFAREHPEFKHWQAVQNGFLALGLHSNDQEGNVISRFEQSNAQHMVSGVVFAHYAVALPQAGVKVYNLNTGEENVMSTIELVNAAQFSNHFTQRSGALSPVQLQYLTIDGQWQQPEATHASQAGIKRGG